MSTQERKAKQRRIALVSICPVQGVECEYHDGVAQRKEEMEWNVAEHFHSFGVRVLAARIRAQFGDAVDVVVFDEIKPDLESLAEKIDEFILWNPVEENLSLEGTPDDPRFAYVKRKK